MTIEKVAVIGSGTMGNGIAHVFALKGYDVTLVDVNQEYLNRAMITIRKNLERQAKKQLIKEEQVQESLSRIKTTISLEQCRKAQLVVEAATEDVTTKRSIFSSLDSICPSETILATNTSSISVTMLASATARPEKVIGMHFMNPVPVMKLVEIINGYATAAGTTATIVSLAEKLDKVPVRANDYPGFISNRILMPMINEAIFCLMEGVADRDAIDTVMKLGMGHPMGPLQLADFIGLDVCLAIMNVLYNGFHDPKYRPCPLLVNMVAAGDLGRKTGQGFYKYEK